MWRTMPGPCRPTCSGSNSSCINKRLWQPSAWGPRLALPTDQASLPLIGEILGLEPGIDCGAAGMPCPEPRLWGVQTCLRGQSAGPAEGRGHRAGGWMDKQ